MRKPKAPKGEFTRETLPWDFLVELDNDGSGMFMMHMVNLSDSGQPYAVIKQNSVLEHRIYINDADAIPYCDGLPFKVGLLNPPSGKTSGAVRPKV